MCEKKVQTTINALKFYIEQQREKRDALHDEFAEDKKKFLIEDKHINQEIKIAQESLAVLDKTSKVSELPEVPVSPEDPKDPTCPSCGNHTNRTKIVIRKGKKVQEWVCLSCGEKFTAPLSIDGIPSELGSRPGAGPQGPIGTQTRVRRGVLDKARKFLDEELAKGRCILLQQITTEADVSDSAAFRAAREVVTKEGSQFEFYKDINVKFHLKGVRPKDASKRRVFCPGCQILMIPGESCKKCPEDGDSNE